MAVLPDVLEMEAPSLLKDLGVAKDDNTGPSPPCWCDTLVLGVRGWDSLAQKEPWGVGGSGDVEKETTLA